MGCGGPPVPSACVRTEKGEAADRWGREFSERERGSERAAALGGAGLREKGGRQLGRPSAGLAAEVSFFFEFFPFSEINSSNRKKK